MPRVPFAIPYGENAFLILGGFRRAAKRAGWSDADISTVVGQATSGDYDNLVKTIKEFI